ncbi:hypothetical protein CN679_16210 [Bacillus pseudomycoides]|nr:hypothetical protein CN679_16210 [Bacillus pseudomycoides]
MWLSNGTRLTLPTGEGVPQGLRGWGVRLRGSGEEFPSGFGQSPRFCFLPCRAWIGGANKPRRAFSFCTWSVA